MNKRKVKYSFAEWCRDNEHQDWLDLWDYELNEVGPDEVAYRSGKKWYFKCLRGLHESETKRLCDLTGGKCRMLCKKCGSFGQWLIDNCGNNAIEEYWSEKNSIDPFEIGYGSHDVVWIKCQSGNHPDYDCIVYVFTSGCRCPYCNGKRIAVGINDIATTRPDLASYFLYVEDTHRYAACSGKHVWTKCPVCGEVQLKQISHMHERGFNCDKCSRGKSYPEQFMYNVLDQVRQKYNIKIYTSHTFDWSKCIIANNDTLSGRKIYDFYIVFDKNIIIETHGKQHYMECAFTKRTLSEEQENDRIKMSEAMRNGFCRDTYVVIDCQQSNKKYIQKSIMKSVLPKLLQFSEGDIDWDKADQQASINITRWICDLWNECNEKDKVNAISEITGLYFQTVYKYLQKGAKLGLCNHGQNRNRPVYCIECNCYFACAKVCAEYLCNILNRKITILQINRSARSGGTTSAYGLHFEYVPHDDFKRACDIQTSMALNEYNEKNLKDLYKHMQK